MEPSIFRRAIQRVNHFLLPNVNRLVSAVLLVILASFLIHVFTTPRDRAWFLLFAVISIFGLAANWRGHAHLGTWLAVVCLSFPSYWNILTRPDQASGDAVLARFSWLAFAVLLSGLILSPYAMGAVILANVCGMLLMTAFVPGLQTYELFGPIGFLITLAGMMWVVVSYRDHTEAARRSQELARERRLNDVTRALTSATDMPELLTSTVRLAAELTDAEACMLSLVSPDGQRLESVHGYNLPQDQVAARPERGKGLAWQVITTGQSILTENYREHPNRLENLEDTIIKAYLGVPVLAGETCLGAVAVATVRANKIFTPRDQDLLEAMARQVGVAIQKARLYAALQSELAERRRAEEALRQREQILEAVAYAAGQFLQSQDWQMYIQTVLAELGQITASSHAYIFQNHPTPTGQMVCTQLYEWTASNARPSLTRMEFQNVPLEGPGLERWRQAMLRAEPFYASRSTMLPGESRYLAPLGAQSILEMPIYLRNTFSDDATPSMEWWGIIGFDDYQQERVWSAAEVDAIKIASGILSAAIQRQRSDQALRQREDIYRRAISSADAVPYYQTYSPNRFAFIGEGIYDLTGYSQEEMTIELWGECVVEAVMLGEQAHLSEREANQLARQGKISNWRCDYQIRTRQGELRWIADCGVELITPSGISSGCIGILQDITTRKETEQAIQTANVLLEQRVQERTAALENANKEMESFAYTVSHDLRAPLRAVDGYSRLLQADYGQLLDEDGRVCLENVRSATQKMNQLIDDLLQLSRITRAEMKTIQVNMSSLCDELLSTLQNENRQRQVQVTIQPDLWVTADPNLLRVALSNLLDNAWKFTRRTSSAWIHIGGEEQDGRMVYYVRDNGAGFDMQYAERLFQAFQRLHNPSEFEGTGVGLATVARVIRRHGGVIWAEGAVNQGATFYFTLPSNAS